MNTVYMLVGLPASGKSTWAKDLVDRDSKVKRINKDDLRNMMQNGKYTPEMEQSVLDARNALIINLFRAGFDIVVDDTNLNPEHKKKIEGIANQLDANLSVVDFTYVPIELCIERDSKRANPVGEQVIRDMYNKYLAK